MVRHVSWSVLLLMALAAPAAAQNPPRTGETFRVHPEAKAAIDQIRSPYCPGLMLEVCTSSGGAMLRDSIERMAERGMKADSIVDIIIGEYGEQWRAKPKRSGSGLLAWLIPPAALMIGGGVVAVVWTLKRHNISILQGGDFLAPLVLLGYGIGRIGCQLAGDGDYGPPSDLPWAMAYPHGVVPTLERVHPTPIYDFLLSTLLFFILWKLRKRFAATGQMFGLGLIALGVERFITEFFRVTPKIAALGITHAQGISLLVIAAGIYLLSHRDQLAAAAVPQAPKVRPKKTKDAG